MVSPGPIANPLDRLFFMPWVGKRTESIQRLFELMFTNSDNTAADAVIRLLGGTQNVMRFLSNEGVDGIRINRTISELLTYYYDLTRSGCCQSGSTNLARSVGDVLTTVRQISPAYACRVDKERCMAESGEDSATPATVSELLARVSTDPRFRQVYDQMLRCRTGKQRLQRGLRGFKSNLRRFAHKTGSLGGIANDVGVVEFSTGYVATLVVMSCRCSATMAARESCIAEVAEVIITDWAETGAIVR